MTDSTHDDDAQRVEDAVRDTERAVTPALITVLTHKVADCEARYSSLVAAVRAMREAQRYYQSMPDRLASDALAERLGDLAAAERAVDALVADAAKETKP